MKQILKIRLEPGEAHVAACAEEAFSLVGGPGWPGCDDRHQPFRRIRGNDFTAQDVARAGEIVRAAVQNLRMKAADEPCPFPEIPGQGGSVAQTWREGLLSNAALAERRISRFETLIEDGLADMPTPS